MQARVLVAAALIDTIVVAVALSPQPQRKQMPLPLQLQQKPVLFGAEDSKPVAVERTGELVIIGETVPESPLLSKPDPEYMSIGALERAD